MRLGQLSRKYDIPVQEIISYLEEQSGAEEKFHANSKLEESTEENIFEYFNIERDEVVEAPIEVVEESIDEVATDDQEIEDTSSEDDFEVKEEVAESTLPETPLDDIASVEGEIETVHEEVQETRSTLTEETEISVSTPDEDEVIQTDKLLELLESEDAPADLDKIKLIKAPKHELSGLKVVGKVELPEPRKKEEKKEEEKEESEFVTEKDLRAYRNPRKKRPPLSEEEKEKRRLRAKRKQEEYEARKEKRLKAQEDQRNKARKEAHYKQKLEQAKAVQVKRKIKEQAPPVADEGIKRPEPKTLLGKFWRWMNT